MRKRILAYLTFIDDILANKLPVDACFQAKGEHPVKAAKDVVPTRKDYEKLLETHLQQIAFFQHERLVHLLVMILFAVLTFSVFFIILFQAMENILNYGMIVLFIALMVLLIPYIAHYYLLENGVQKMYAQYDEILKRIRC